jgi:8-oxo-dGTP pyrophosphatase MutT (NUDIX family)
MKDIVDFERIREILRRRVRRRIYRAGFKSSAVAIINHRVDQKLHILFTIRSDKVRHHQGQISFPGGAREKNERLLNSAIRETYEELKILLNRDECIGALDDILTISKFRVTPFVFVTDRDIFGQIQPNDEIREVINIPLEFLLNCTPRVEGMRFGRTQVRQYFYDYNGYIVWGATGRILKQYLDIIELSRSNKK